MSASMIDLSLNLRISGEETVCRVSVVVILLSIPSIAPSRMMDAAKFLLWPSVDVIVSNLIG